MVIRLKDRLTGAPLPAGAVVLPGDVLKRAENILGVGNKTGVFPGEEDVGRVRR